MKINITGSENYKYFQTSRYFYLLIRVTFTLKVLTQPTTIFVLQALSWGERDDWYVRKWTWLHAGDHYYTLHAQHDLSRSCNDEDAWQFEAV